jgi:hypothetical protein
VVFATKGSLRLRPSKRTRTYTLVRNLISALCEVAAHASAIPHLGLVTQRKRMKFKLDIDAPCTTAPRRKSFCTLPFFSLLENSHLPPSFYRSIKRGSSFRTHLRKVHGFMPDNFNIGDCSEPLMGNYEEFSPDTSASSCYSTPPSRVGPELLPYRDSPGELASRYRTCLPYADQSLPSS